MELTVRGICTTRINVKLGAQAFDILESTIELERPAGMDKGLFLDQKGMVTAEGVEMLTMILVSSLASNVHCAADSGLWDRASHMRHIFSTLEDMFVAQGEMVDKKKR